jgi:hypothetical protein
MGRSGGAAAERPPEAGPERLGPALQELYRALHTATIYPEGHPESAAAVGRAHRALLEALPAGQRVVLGVAPGHLLWQGLPFGEDQGPLRSLANLLHELEVAALEISPGQLEDDLARFAARVSRSRRPGGEELSLREDLEAAGVESIRVAHIDYRGLNFTDRVGARDENETPVDVWDRLVNTITDPSSYRTGLAPEAVAGEVERQLARTEGVGVGDLRRRMHALTRRMESMGERDREALRARLASFVGGLSSGMRQDLLLVEGGGEEESLAFVAELADSLPDPVLLEVLRNVDARGQKVPPQLFTLLNKLVRVSSEQAPVAQGLQDVLGRWGVSPTLAGGDPAALHRALEEVFEQRQEVHCNPESYQGLLEDLSGQELGAVTRAVFERYRDPRDPVAVQTQTAEIALRLLEEESREEEQAGLLGYLGAVTDTLLEGGQYHPVRDTAVAARRLCARDGVGEAGRRAAEGFLQDLTSRRRIDRILEGVCRGDQLPRAGAALLALGGTVAVDRILESLAQTGSRTVAQALHELAARMGPEPMREVLERRAARGWASVEAAFAVIRLMPVREAVILFEGLTRSDNPRVRQEAYLALYELDRRPGSPERHLARALRDGSPRIPAAAVQLLFSLGRPESIELLGAFLEGKVEGAEPGPALARRVAQGLAALGERGRRRLCGALDVLRRSFRPREARRGHMIRRTLAPHRGEGVVRRALDSWRFSPAALLSCLARGEGEGEGEDEEETGR